MGTQRACFSFSLTSSFSRRTTCRLVFRPFFFFEFSQTFASLIDLGARRSQTKCTSRETLATRVYLLTMARSWRLIFLPFISKALHLVPRLLFIGVRKSETIHYSKRLMIHFRHIAQRSQHVKIWRTLGQ